MMYSMGYGKEPFDGCWLDVGIGAGVDVLRVADTALRGFPELDATGCCWAAAVT